MGQIRPVVITVTPIEIISSCTCVTEEIICPHVLSSPCVSMQVQAQRLGCRGGTSCTVWNKLSFHHTGFMSTWWKESVRTTSISCCSFQCPGGSCKPKPPIRSSSGLQLLSVAMKKVLPAPLYFVHCWETLLYFQLIGRPVPQHQVLAPAVL